MSNNASNRWLKLVSDDRIVLGFLVFCLVWFVGGTFDTQAISFVWFGLAALGAVTARMRRRRTPNGSDFQATATGKLTWAKRIANGLLVALMIASLMAIFSWRFTTQVRETASLLVLAVDTIAHCAIALCCILWSVWSARGHVMLLLLGLVAVLMGVAGGGISSTLTAQTAVGLATCIGFLVAAQIIMSRKENSSGTRMDPRPRADAFVEVVRIPKPDSGFGSQDERAFRFSFVAESWPYLLLSVSLVLIVASGLARVGETILPGVQAEVFSQLKDRFEDPTSVSFLAGGRYVSGNRIGDIQTSLLNDPAGLALRGYCASEPGYLRGNVFDDYTDGRWSTQRRWQLADESGRSTTYRSRLVRRLFKAKVPLSENANPVRDRFPLDLFNRTQDPLGPSIVGTIEIYGQPDRGPQTFFPATSVWIEAKADKIGVTPHGLIDRGIEPNQPWVVGVGAEPISEPLTSAERGLMLWVDPRIRPAIEAAARSAIRTRPTRDRRFLDRRTGGERSVNGADVAETTLGVDAKAIGVANYFQTRFTYTLRTELPPPDIDPLVHFITTEHPAHCEYFASAAALMLRTLDIPTRYVTGYVMDEMSDSQDYYLARNRDAHAWVEYYDESKRQWKPLETTPGRIFQTIESGSTTESNLNGLAGRDEFESVSSSWLRGFVGYFTSLRVTDTLSVMFQFLQIPVLVLLTGWLWWRSRAEETDAESQQLIAQRRKMDRRLKRWGWVRRATETLHQFAARLEEASPEDPKYQDLKQASAWYRDHAIELYRQRALSPAGD